MRALSWQHKYTTSAETPPVVSELRALFHNLDDAPLLAALVGPARRGPKGHSIQTLWRSFVAKHVLGLESTRALIRELVNNPYVAQVCGVTGDVPHEATFSRFFAKVADVRYLHLVKDVSRRLTRHHYATLPGFGERVALDSTTLLAWSNGGKPNHSDRDANWSVKKNTHGKTEFKFGYKLHLLTCCETELPIAAKVTPGNVHDAAVASNVLSEARVVNRRFHPAFFMADSGYSGQALFHLLRRQYRTTPIIQVNPSHKRLRARESATTWTPEWTALYKQRQAVERAFSRLKGQRSLNHIRVRRLAKVTLHCYLSLIAMQAALSLRPSL